MTPSGHQEGGGAESAGVVATGLADATGSQASVIKALQSIGAVVAPTTLITALLYYFGWARISAQAQYLGLDASLLGYSTQDYLLRSISAAYVPFGASLIVALLLLVTDRWIKGRLERQPGSLMLKWMTRGLLLCGAISLVAGWLGTTAAVGPSSRVKLLSPVGLIFGVGGVSYAVHLTRQARQQMEPRRVEMGKATRGAPALEVILVAILLSLTVVWEVAVYANYIGIRHGEELALGLTGRPTVTVLSSKRLNIDAPGVSETVLEGPESAYGFRYTGLKLLSRTGGKYFLMSAGWSRSDGVTIVLPDSDLVRLEFTPGAG
jgi:hypothetical protein